MLSRGKGILLPVFSLFGKENIGTLGQSAFSFVDFLKETHQNYWQILPLTPVDEAGSPYSSKSAFAGEPLLIDLDLLAKQGLTEKENGNFKTNSSRVDYEAVRQEKMPILIKAAQNFKKNEDFLNFKKENAFWLEDYAEFVEKEKGTDRETTKIIQFFFFSQWLSLKNYANEKGVFIIGDIPFYVGANSVDIISNPKIFRVGNDLTPTLVSGVPPDEFSPLGQLWETPVYNFEKQRENGFAWWKKRIEFSAKIYDVIRLDHFRAFSAFYAVPSGEKTAKNGQWVKGVGYDFFEKLKNEFKKVRVIAEDLGHSDEQVKELLKKTGFPTMKVLQFAFDGNEKNPFLPQNYPKNCVCYTGTHDNSPFAQWHENADEAAKAEFDRCTADLSGTPNEKAIKILMKSRADTVIIPLCDYLEGNEDYRINTPGVKSQNNWSWRLKREELSQELKKKITRVSKR